MEISEFLDSYSDDLISLQEGRLALLTHPLNPHDAAADLINASFCRMLAIVVVGSIEAMLSEWIERDRVHVLEKYFAEGIRNGDRIQSLYEAFHNAGIPVDRGVFDDYLAIKYLRNTIIHGKWKAHEMEWVAGRGFPTDSRGLTLTHWTRILHVNESMMLYIALTEHATPGITTKPSAVIKLGEHSKEQDPHVGILRQRDIDKILWNNLERISSVFGTAIQEAAASAEYDWSSGQSPDQLQTLSPVELKRRFYTAAWRAGREGFERLDRHRLLAGTALECWRDYYHRATGRLGLHDSSFAASLATFDEPRFDPTAPYWSLLQNVNEPDRAQLLRQLWPSADADVVDRALSALHIGHQAYDLFPNVMPVLLLGVQLPIIDPAGTQKYSKEFDRAYGAVRLGRVWYQCVEHNKVFHSENLDLYRRLQSEFAMKAGFEIGS